MKKIGNMIFFAGLLLGIIIGCSEESTEIGENTLAAQASESYSQDEPAQLYIEHSQVLTNMEYYYFIDQNGYYHFFDQGRPTCPDSTRQAIKAEVVNLAEANNFYSLDNEMLWFEFGSLHYGIKRGIDEEDENILASGPRPAYCPDGTYAPTVGYSTFSKSYQCNAGTKNKPKSGTQMCSVNTRLCVDNYTGDTSKSTQSPPYNCGNCRKNAKTKEDFGEEVIITPYCL